MTANLRQQLDPAVLAGFAARGVGATQAIELVDEASSRLTAEELRAACETLSQTRLLSWPDCVRFALLRRPMP
jgi:hypothetical protein